MENKNTKNYILPFKKRKRKNEIFKKVYLINKLFI